jgi:N-hydroxyarylamine O-acetyltransferase
MDIARYLDRIGHRGAVAPTPDTLRRLHRAHLTSISYENLDIHLGRRLELDPAAFFRKLVIDRRGGWCYEMNGLFGWALGELGFDVVLLSGTVGREVRGARAEGSHLLLLVHLDRPYLADVGFGDGFPEAVPLVAGSFRQSGFEFRLDEQVDRWVVHNHQWGGARGFDFTLEPRKLEDFAERCLELQTALESAFVQKTVCQRWVDDGVITLRGALFRRVTPAGVSERVLDNPADYAEVLAHEFDLRDPDLPGLWPRVWERHMEWAAAKSRGG